MVLLCASNVIVKLLIYKILLLKCESNLIFIFFVLAEIKIIDIMSLYDNTEDVFLCPQSCGKNYKTIASLNKHVKYECNKPPQYKCYFCNKMCKRPDNINVHMKTVHGFYINYKSKRISKKCSK
jgi:hypothetical protein